MTRLRLFAVVSALALVAVPSAYAAGLWWGLPILGGPTYCVSFTGAAGTTCASTAPAGPTFFTGSEAVPADILNNTDRGPSSVYLSVTQLGNGPVYNQNPVGTTQTIPNMTPFYLIAGAQGSAFTVTMPATPIEGQIQRIICTGAGTVGAMTVVANTGQTISNAVAAACTTGSGFAWRYVVASSEWLRYQ